MNPRKGRSSNSKEMGISEEPSRNCCFQPIHRERPCRSTPLQCFNGSLGFARWNLSIAKEGPRCKMKRDTLTGAPPSPKHKHWNIGVKEKSFAAYIYIYLYIPSFPLSLKNYQHQSVVARKTEKLEIIPVSSPRVAAVQLSPHGRLQIVPGTTSCHAVSACWQSHLQR